MASARALSILVAAGRVGVGAAMLAAPSRVGRPWVGAPAETAGGTVAIRALGVRDLAVGALAVAALRGRLGEHAALPATLRATGAACDAVDGLALLAARRDLPALGTATGLFALGAAAAGFTLAHRVR